MIKVIHTNIDSGEKEESNFESQAEFESHQYFNNPEWSNEVVDITQQVFIGENLKIRENEMAACHEVIKLVGMFNKSKPQGTVLSILTNPSMQSAIMALLTGAPATAKTLIQSVSTELYSQAEKDQVIEVLNSVIPAVT